MTCKFRPQPTVSHRNSEFSDVFSISKAAFHDFSMTAVTGLAMTFRLAIPFGHDGWDDSSRFLLKLRIMWHGKPPCLMVIILSGMALKKIGFGTLRNITIRIYVSLSLSIYVLYIYIYIYMIYIIYEDDMTKIDFVIRCHKQLDISPHFLLSYLGKTSTLDPACLRCVRHSRPRILELELFHVLKRHRAIVRSTKNGHIWSDGTDSE